LSYAEAGATDQAAVLKDAACEVTLLTGAARDVGLTPTKANIERHLKVVRR
jgi:hypothetical protein